MWPFKSGLSLSEPPLTGGRKAISSFSRNIVPGFENSWFLANKIDGPFVTQGCKAFGVAIKQAGKGRSGGYFGRFFGTTDDILQHSKEQHPHPHVQMLAGDCGPAIVTWGGDANWSNSLPRQPPCTRAGCACAMPKTDQMGVVYYANYLVWMEVGRVELVRALDLEYKKLEQSEGLYLSVIEVTCRYLYPARYDQEIGVETRVTKATGADGGICISDSIGRAGETAGRRFNETYVAESGNETVAAAGAVSGKVGATVTTSSPWTCCAARSTLRFAG